MLTTKQKVKLRSLAMDLRPIFQVGKEGLSDNLIQGLNDALEARELIKISVLKTVSAPLKQVAYDLVSATNSELIQIIGRQIVLYKQSDEAKNPIILK